MKTNNEPAKDAQHLHALAEIYHKTLGEPNSESYDEEKYIIALENLLAEPNLSEADSLRVDYRLRMAKKNRAGSIATDFSMKLSNGRILRLSEVESQLLVLVFYDPECPYCREIINDLEIKLNGSEVNVLAVYTEGKEDVWKETIKDMPQSWTIAIDQDNIIDNELYSIPAMPTIYLLNKEKKVILKDPIPEYIDFFLKQNSFSH